jgi:membrane protease subunit HflK
MRASKFRDLNAPDFSKAKKEFSGGDILKKIATGLIVLIIAIALFRCFYTVNEQNNAVVTQFGQVIKVNTAGLYFKAPWQSVKKVDMTTHGTGIGYTIDKDGQNITDTDNGIMITSDFNLLNIDFYLEYRVSDPVAYLYNSEKPEEVLSNIAMANIRTVVSNYTVDEAMTTGKSKIQSDIKEAMIKELENRNIGLTVVNITIQDSAPPTEDIVAAFKSVETAKQGADTAKNNALQYQNQQIPEAEAKADEVVQKAQAKKESRIAEAEGQVARLNKTYEEYQKYPLVTKRRMFYEKMEEILPDLKVIITDGSTQTMLPLDSFTGDSQ